MNTQYASHCDYCKPTPQPKIEYNYGRYPFNHRIIDGILQTPIYWPLTGHNTWNNCDEEGRMLTNKTFNVYDMDWTTDYMNR
jgi:hypothetical protein